MKDEHTKMQTEPTAKRAIKDSVFTDLFSDEKYLLMLYQSLHPEDKATTVRDLKYVTLENVLVNDLYNDLGLLVGNRLMILVEAQSTWSPNIAVRSLLYLAKTYQDYLTETHQSLYSSRRVSLPEPELYVLYTGARKLESKNVSFAEDFFAGRKTALDVSVKVLTDGVEGDIISQYITFTRIIDEQTGIYGRTEEAVRAAIKLCRERNVLEGYLTGREKEVVGIMVKLYDQDEVLRDYIASEKREQAQETAQNLHKMQIPIEQISKAVGYDEKTVKEWLGIK
ncbi:MAG: hypothetical protein LUH43_04465 [Clostridia bacterium]|nr:hypothetical protein [Clostridia bacterium]